MPSLVPLDTRKQGILKAVVTDYVRTAEPVGSHALVSRYTFGVRSATIRNEMAELSDMGYLRQPHTSAGRIPSDLGYRFYVDRLMDASPVTGIQAIFARRKLASHGSELGLVLEQTCRILSELSHYTSLATSPVVKESVIRHVSVARVGPRKLLFVMVLDNGRVFHELIEHGSDRERFDPVTTTNFLMGKLAGRSLGSASAVACEPVQDGPGDAVGLLGKVREFIDRELELAGETDIHLEGANYIMQQPEFKDVDRLEAVLSILEQRSALYRLFSSVYLGPEVTVIIGAENPVGEMRDCSFVGTKYRIAGRVAGTIGILGPTRMDYRRAVGALEFMARNLEELLANLSAF